MSEEKKKSIRKCQKSAVLDYMKQGNTLTTIEASEKFGCTRLPARISDYRREGYHFQEEWIAGVTRYGTSTRYKRYRLIEEV